MKKISTLWTNLEVPWRPRLLSAVKAHQSGAGTGNFADGRQESSPIVPNFEALYPLERSSNHTFLLSVTRMPPSDEHSLFGQIGAISQSQKQNTWNLRVRHGSGGHFRANAQLPRAEFKRTLLFNVETVR